MRSAALVLVVLAVLAIAPAALAKTQTETASSGQVTATLTYDYNDSPYGTSDFQNLTMAIDRAGMRLVDEPVGDRCELCWPAGFGSPDAPSVVVRDLDGDDEPEVLYDLFTGGANCCFVTLVWRYLEAPNSYQLKVLRPGGSFLYSLKDLNKDGSPEFVSRDERFAYKYGANIETPRPVRIFDWEQGSLVDVTIAYPARAEREAASLYKLYLRMRKEKQTNVRGVIAAYVADEYSAGRGRIGWRRVVAAYDRGDLDKLRRFDTGPYGRAYLKSLRSFLKKLGYLRRA
jgi:hypothetical protein